MKDFISSTLLVVASFSGAVAADSSSPSAPRDVPADLSASLQNSDANGDELRAGDFAGALACTADLSTGAVTDEAGCATATDAGGAACVWCDASAIIGQGACVSPDIKSMAGQFWDQLCAEDAGDSSSSPAPRDVLADLELRAGDFAGALACTADLSTGDVTDEASCATATDAGGAACVWCDASAILGQGACVSPDIKSFAGQFWDQLCAEDAAESSSSAPRDVLAELSASLQNHDAQGNDLRAGDFAGALACTADLSTGEVTDEAGCATATDGGGAPCVWCDASAIIGQGACVSSDIKSMAGQFWDQLCAGDAGSGPATPHGLRGRLAVE